MRVDLRRNVVQATGQKPPGFEEIAQALRPKLHRYCARMAGSAIDGEDIVQDALLKAMQAFPGDGSIANPEAWLFRIAHNAALDFLRSRVRLEAVVASQPGEDIADPGDEVARRQVAAMGLRPFMKLSPAERSSVILMDVIGYSLSEIGEIIEVTVPAVKAALHRGRTRLKALSDSADTDAALILTDREHERLARYVDRFNAGDFDAVRDMLAEDVRLELVGRLVRRGKSSVSHYFTNYGARSDWLLSVGFVEGRPAVLLHRTHDTSGAPANFILLEWKDGSIIQIRDFHYAAHVAQGITTSAA
ncbi:sigma-70 family RNA polymerase sigma factor [Reyranella sp.]|uniref:sigma-70 family RNA polymerase sigma factor n=1 Tax=Reyranella sp. TaxID=1929291 RepID=UPI003D0F0EA1